MGQQHLSGDEAWLIGEHRMSGEKKYYLANLPAETRSEARRSELPADPWCRFANSHSATWNWPACLRPPSTGCPECAACGGTAPTGNRRPDQFYPGRIHLKVTKDTNGPGQAACREPLTERRADAVSGICQPAEANTGWDHAINLGQRDLWLASRYAMLDWNTGTLHPSPGCSSNSRDAMRSSPELHGALTLSRNRCFSPGA